MLRSLFILAFSFVIVADLGAQHRVYWADFNASSSSSGCIESAALDGSARQVIVPPTGPKPFDLVIDHAAGRMYWTTASPSAIWSSDLLGGGASSIVSGSPAGGSPRAIDLDGAGRVYWTNISQGDVRRANVNGTNAQVIASSGTANKFSLAVDPRGTGKLYWGDSGTITSAELNGSNATVILNVNGSPAGLAVDVLEDKLYWIETSGRVWRSNLDGSGPQFLFQAPGGSTSGLALDPCSRTLYWARPSAGVFRATVQGAQLSQVVGSVSFATGVDLAVSDPIDLQVTPNPIQAGQPVRIDATNATPFTNLFLNYSLKGIAFSYDPAREIRVCLNRPIQAGSAMQASATGAATWNLPVPSKASGRNVWIQALQFQRTSPVFGTFVQ